MISIEQLRKIDPELNSVTDEDLELVRAKLYELGQLLFDEWIKTKAVPTIPVGSSLSSVDRYKI